MSSVGRAAVLDINTKDTRRLLGDDGFEALAEDILIVPKFSTEQAIDCIKGKFGPFRANSAAKVPLWAALQMQRLQQCSIELPKWLEEEELKKLCEEEKTAGLGRFCKVERHYIEIAFALLSLPRVFGGDEKQRSRIVLLMRELIELRRDKIIAGIRDFDASAGEIRVTHMSAAEITCFRTRSLHVLDTFVSLLQNRRLEKDAEGLEEFEAEEVGTQNEDSSSRIL